jgi:hypothetical protein
MVELQTRPPTGQVAYPLVLVEHEEKAGGSYALAQFAASPRVGRTFVLDTGDGTADEYASLGPYEILVHDGTWPSMIGQIEAATKAPRSDPEKPNVVGIDHGSAIWQMLSLWTDERARRSESGRKKLEKDPDAEIDATVNLWNDAKSRWGRMMFLLKNFDGIGVILAHGSDVVKVEGGVPTKETVWSTVVEKNTEGVVSAIVRVRRPHAARLIGVRSLTIEVPGDGLALPDQGMLDHVVFEILGAGGFAASTSVAATTGMPTPAAKASVLDRVKAAYPDSLTDKERAEEAGRLWALYGLPSKVEEVPADKVNALLLDIADGKTQVPPEEPPEGEGQEPTTPPQEPQDGPGEAAAPDAPPAQEEPVEEPPAETAETADQTADGPIDLLGVTYSRSDAAHWLEDARRPALVQVAKVERLLATGQTDAIRLRLLTHFGLTGLDPTPADAPTEDEAAAAVGEAFGGAEEVELIDVPEGWSEGKCLCGEPLTFKPGDQRNTIRHLDPTLDANHPAEEPFE